MHTAYARKHPLTRAKTHKTKTSKLVCCPPNKKTSTQPKMSSSSLLIGAGTAGEDKDNMYNCGEIVGTKTVVDLTYLDGTASTNLAALETIM